MDQDDDNEAQQASYRRTGAEFIMSDIELAFTFLDVARTSLVADTRRRNQMNARTAYEAILRFLPRSLSAFSAAERQAMKGNVAELKNRLEQLGEIF